MDEEEALRRAIQQSILNQSASDRRSRAGDENLQKVLRESRRNEERRRQMEEDRDMSEALMMSELMNDRPSSSAKPRNNARAANNGTGLCVCFDVMGDGNCFYYAVASAIAGMQLDRDTLIGENKRLRKRAFDAYIRDPHLKRDPIFVEQGRSEADEVRGFVKDGQYAQDMQMEAMARALGMCIEVLVFDRDTFYRMMDQPIPYSRLAASCLYTRNFNFAASHSRTLHLLNLSNVHFGVCIPFARS